MKKFGYKKGSLNKALKEAVIEWIYNQSNTIPIFDQPTEEMKNLLQDLQETSVELQHIGKQLFIKDD